MEQKTLYEANNKVNDTYTVTLGIVGMIRDLVERGYGKNKSDIVRQALEAYYDSKEQDNGHES